MPFIWLTITFFASAANTEMTTRFEVIDLRMCQELAAKWSTHQDGMLKVISATCEPASSASGSKAP